MNDVADELRAWLRDVMARAGDSPTSLARRSSLAQTTITRFLLGEAETILSMRSVSKIAAAVGIEPPQGMMLGHAVDPAGVSVGATPTRVNTPRGLSEPESQPYDVSRESPVSAAIRALSAERPNAAPFIMRSDALALAGIARGDILLVDLDVAPKAGDVACAQVYDFRAGTAETVFRLYEPPYLLSQSRESRSRRPLVVDNDRVALKGSVVAVIRIPG